MANKRKDKDELQETPQERFERERREALERTKDEQIKQRRKDSDGEPLV